VSDPPTAFQREPSLRLHSNACRTAGHIAAVFEAHEDSVRRRTERHIAVTLDKDPKGWCRVHDKSGYYDNLPTLVYALAPRCDDDYLVDPLRQETAELLSAVLIAGTEVPVKWNYSNYENILLSWGTLA
jgi:hypothetical protein